MGIKKGNKTNKKVKNNCSKGKIKFRIKTWFS